MTSAAHGALYVGLISGTSMDGIDAALVRLGNRRCETLATRAHAYPETLRERLLGASRDPRSASVDDVGRLDRAVGECFRDAAVELLDAAGVSTASISAIGSHGQTLRHLPRDASPFSLQIGDPNIIAAGTGITTVADFRRRDLALGGEGAPLAPAFHHWLFSDRKVGRAVLNVGGIANLTVLPTEAAADPDRVVGFDTGPGNTLMDTWSREMRGEAYDAGGAWADSGRCDQDLLDRLLADAYFDEPPPKSTGFEHFNLDWVAKRLGDLPIEPANVQATLLELSVRTIASAVSRHAPGVGELFVCGGGVHNAALMQALEHALPKVSVASTAVLGVEPDWVEAALFAWLASRTLEARTGNLPSVTGAKQAEVLGGIYPAVGRRDSG